MASTKGSDILMKVVRNGTAIAGEGQSELAAAKKDSLTDGFASGQFFEINDFGFNIGSKAGAKKMTPAEEEKFLAEHPGYPLPKNMTSAQREEFRRDYPTHPLPAEAPPPSYASPGGEAEPLVIDVEPVTFSKDMDSASPVLFAAFVNSETLDSFTIVKRKAAGSDRSGKAYLRLDFTDVLLIDLDMDDDDEVVKEKWKFIARKVDMRFREQNNDGSMGPVIPGGWVMTAAKSTGSK